MNLMLSLSATTGTRIQTLIWQFALFFSIGATVMFAGTAAAAAPNPKDSPPVFVQAVADQLLDVLKKDAAARQQNTERVNAIVERYVMPYVDFEKTTRLAAGKHWRDATPAQRKALADAFRMTLVRTYSGALSLVDNSTRMEVLPFRAEQDAKDVVVRFNLIQSTNAQPIRIDYRLEQTPKGWSIYDINVENVWLIQNYRNQFSQQISQTGIDGLIAALNERNTTK
jgi:phospholipid transport system substrate-binding protein